MIELCNSGLFKEWGRVGSQMELTVYDQRTIWL